MDVGLASLVVGVSDADVEESRAFAAGKQAAGGQRGPASYEELQRARSSLPARPADGHAVEQVAHTGTREVHVRVTTPTTGAARASFLDIHGGGFYMDSAIRNDARNAPLADALGVTVVSVDYRLAPEHPWPAAPDDCETAPLWLLEKGLDELGTERLLIGGASAGATLTATTLVRLRDRQLIDRVSGAVLQFGAYDLSGHTPSGKLYADEWFIQAYAGHISDRTHPDISPLYADLRNLPPCLLVVGALDVLLEDNLAMAARLSAAGNDVNIQVYPEAMHGFTSHPTAIAAAASDAINTWLERRLDAAPLGHGGPRGGSSTFVPRHRRAGA